MNNLQLSIVVPCYNEEDVLPETASQLKQTIFGLIESGKISEKSQVVFIDDGSKDKTWSIIEELSRQDITIKGIKLSCNRGHQNALLAGLLNTSGDVLISIDADLQDDINVIEIMIDKYQEGYDIVYGVRSDRTSDSMFKRSTAQIYYKLLKFFGVDIIYNHADFRLTSRRAVEALRQFGEINLFLRGIIKLVGFNSTIVQYKRKERFAGETKYPLNKMLSLAFNGITSFSAVPLRFIALIGFIVFLASIGMIFWVLWIKIFTFEALPGWASSVIPVYFIGGVQLLSIGVLGEYISKLYIESKNRPRYIIEKKLTDTSDINKISDQIIQANSITSCKGD